MNAANQVTAEPAIFFECVFCGHNQFDMDSLEHQWLDNRVVDADTIACDRCGKDNFVVREL